MFYRHDGDVDHGPVADDAEEGLQCVFEVDRGAAADYNCGDGSEGDEGNPRDAEGPGAKILRVKGE